MKVIARLSTVLGLKELLGKVCLGAAQSLVSRRSENLSGESQGEQPPQERLKRRYLTRSSFSPPCPDGLKTRLCRNLRGLKCTDVS
ncbi:MAG TPA: hypothetical protein PKV84_08175 [Candidatus Omnitrophota bacterium]|nr:hypothetical protein [Candidatus Omnitrophota bacterium]